MASKKNKLIVILLVVLCAFFKSSPLQAQATLLASWPFNNSAEDASGNGFDATLKGDAGYTDDAVNGSHSLWLKGSPDYVYVGPMDLGAQFTICAWTFLEPDVSNIQTIIGNAAGGSTIDGFKLFINNWETSNKAILIETSDGAARLDAASAENTFEEDSWNHIAVTIDKQNGLAQIFYNGKDVTLSGAIVPNLQSTESVTIGAMADRSWYWTGMIDDLRIYQGLLTPDEIVDVMNSPETSVAARSPKIVHDFHLCNFPNPFNPQTSITFELKKRGFAQLDIVNIRGEHIRTLLSEQKSAGRFSIPWDGLDDSGRAAPSGSYLCRLLTDDFSQTLKMALLR